MNLQGMTNDYLYWLRFHKFQQSREKHFAPLINEALNHQYKQFISNYAIHGKEAVLKITSEPLSHILKHLYLDAGRVYGAKIRADLTRHKKVELKDRMPIGFNERMHQLITDYFGTDILNTSELITETTRQLIQQILIDNYQKSINEIVAIMEKTDLSRVRSRLIARTETVTAANKGAMFAAKDTGLQLNKRWLSVQDRRTRNDHRNVDGQIVPFNDAFNVGGYAMLQPGDRGSNGNVDVPPSEICNCRCTVTFQPLRDSNGRLITT